MRFRFPGQEASSLAANATASDIRAVAQHPTKTDAEATIDERSESSDDETDEKIDSHAQHGTQAAQAMTKAWSRTDLYIAYAMIWIILFILSFSNGIGFTLTPYVTSSFSLHSLTALTQVISGLIAGLFKLPYAKIMDVWGRPQAFSLMIVAITMGLIMMASCQNVTTYCAAQVFYWLGFNGIDFSITVFIADTSQLKNRGLMLAFVSSPYLITTWIYGFAANGFIYKYTLAWGFGTFAIIVPIICTPFAALLWIKQSKAKQMGILPARKPMTFLQILKEFDVAGILILATGLSLFLLAFNLYSYQADEWKSPLILGFLVVGFVLIVCFGLWERFAAPTPFVPWHLLKNRTVVFTYVMAAAIYAAFYIWDSYFYSLLIVLFDQTVVNATYILNIYTISSCFGSLVYGVALRYYGKLKWYSLFFGAPITILGCGLMILFRQPHVNIGYVVMCQLFIGFGGAVLVISEQTTIMAVSKQRDFPALLAMEAMVIAIAGAVGSTIATAMWTGIFPVKLIENLPADSKDQFSNIYASLYAQSGYPTGGPVRDGINTAYGETQRLMLIAATCIYAVAFVAIALWQNVDVKKQKQATVGRL